jgi:pimeloyl-ACP methyl ester carboxylesterase
MRNRLVACLQVTHFVLIHSTGQGAAGWDRVREALIDGGHAARAVELPNDETLSSTDFSNLISEQAGSFFSPVVVVHSGSGPLLPPVARHLRAAHQVWLAAWVPDERMTFIEDVCTNIDPAFNSGWIGKDPTTDDAVAIEFLYHDCGEETRAWALSTRRLFYPSAVYQEKIGLAREIPSTYIVATEDRTITPGWQRRMARERLGVEPVELQSGHCPNVSQPERLAGLLAGLEHAQTA